LKSIERLAVVKSILVLGILIYLINCISTKILAGIGFLGQI